MSKSEPTIQKYMTTQPYSINAGENLSEAESLMSKHRIRHLPVVQNDKVVGILSDRDIKMASGIRGVDISALPVMDICTERPYVVGPDALLREVSEVMASKHYGSAIILQNEKLVGIFTTVDACRALAEVIGTRFHER